MSGSTGHSIVSWMVRSLNERRSFALRFFFGFRRFSDE